MATKTQTPVQIASAVARQAQTEVRTAERAKFTVAGEHGYDSPEYRAADAAHEAAKVAKKAAQAEVTRQKTLAFHLANQATAERDFH